MNVKEYTAKKSIGKKITIKTRTGGYDSDEKNAELTVTFVGPVDSKKANDYVNSRVEHLLEGTDDDPDWIKNRDENIPNKKTNTG